MADESEQTEDAAPSNAELAARVDGLDSKLDTILKTISGKEGKAHTAAQQHTEERLDRPTSVADEIRRQLEEKQRADDAKSAANADADWRSGVDTRLAELTEKQPEPPPRRIEKVWGWR